MGEKALAQVGEVSVGISGRRHPFVHLDDVHTGPWHLFIGQRMQHLPWGVPSAEGHDEAAAHGHARARLRGGEGGTLARDRVRISERFDPHGDFTVGFCQPPGGATLESTSFGPQVPGSYS